MTNLTNNKRVLDEVFTDHTAASNSSDMPASGSSMSARYYFNLTNGDIMIRDEEGVQASSLRAAGISAMEAVEELRAADPLNSDGWQGWRLEIVDASGQAVHAIPLDALSRH